MNVYQWEKGKWKGVLIDKEGPKNKPHQITLALNLTALKFNDLVTLDFSEIQSNGGGRFNV